MMNLGYAPVLSRTEILGQTRVVETRQAPMHVRCAL